MLLTEKERLLVSNPVFRDSSLEGSHLKPTYLHKQWNGIESSDYNPVVNIPSEDVESSSTPFNYLLHADALLVGEKQLTSWHSEQQLLATYLHCLQRSSQLAQYSVEYLRRLPATGLLPAQRHVQ